jgi:predicted Abi (CAAX) family protease
MAKESNYQRYIAAAWTRPDFYPLDQPIDSAHYRPVATWMGRLVANAGAARDPEGGCGLELYHTDERHTGWVGKQVRLRYGSDPATQARNLAVTRDVNFDAAAQKLAQEGCILSERVNGWRKVAPLESLAAGHPQDDIIVRLVEPVAIEESPADGGAPILRIAYEPVQITGRYVGLVTFVAPLEGQRWRVRHFNRASGVFDGAEEIVAAPPPIADSNGTFPSTSAGIEQSPLNGDGWYIYGALGREGLFVVQAWTPRALLRLQPQQVIGGQEAGWNYVRHKAWSDLVARKGTIDSTLIEPDCAEANSVEARGGERAALARWQVGERALLLHTYSGIGGKEREPSARAHLYFGHFAFGIATVIDEPLAGEASFEIVFYQIYTQNADGVVAGALDWSRFIGDRQFGWGGVRPTCNILIRCDDLSAANLAGSNGEDNHESSALAIIHQHLEQMAARYRIGDGRGATYVSAANNCAQDSGQAFYGALKAIAARAAASPSDPAQAARLEEIALTLQAQMCGLPARRSDWRDGVENLGIRQRLLPNLWRGLESRRCLLPRKTSDTVAHLFLQQDAALWLLCTYQIGGYNPNIEPISLLTF